MSVPGWHDKRIVETRDRPVGNLDVHRHITMVVLEDGTEVTAGEVMRQIRDRLANYVIVAPAYKPGVPLPVMVQIVECGHCGEKVLFA